MREIKFKYIVRRKNGHIFSEIFTLKQIENGEALKFLELNHAREKDVFKCQYIEMEDKYSVEAYDGDIILMSDEAYILPEGKVVIEYFHGIPNVHPIDSRFYIGNAHELCRDRLGNHKPKHGISGKIIGNIHEVKK